MLEYTHWILGVGNEPIPASIDEFIEWRRQQPEGYHVVKQDTVNGAWVSTVFLHGVNHRWSDGPPVLWETMIFDAEPQGWLPEDLDGFQRRYTSHEDALAGHAEALDVVQRAASVIAN